MSTTVVARPEDKVWGLTPPFTGSQSHLWLANLPVELHGLTDIAGAGQRSRLRLFEDDRALGPPHALHESIRLQGKGRYSFWRDTLYFSTSDGSDPNTNGRAYRVVSAESRSVAQVITTPGSAREWVAPERPIRCTVLGMGNRGFHLARMAQGFAGVEVRWLVDLSRGRLEHSLEALGRSVSASTDWIEAVDDPAIDAVFVTLPDHLHRLVAERAFRMGKHVYLEKPIATNMPDALAIMEAWQASGRVLQIGYVLRQTPYYRAIRDIVRGGVLGPVRLVHSVEQLDVRHGASFMRRWHSESALSGGLIVHKCCHDLDLICWLLGTRARGVASFGGASTFSRQAPAAYCSQCAERPTCPYADEGLHERRTPQERANPTAFGLDRCVFRDGKDIVDNQVVAFELASGVRGSHHLAVQGRRTERRITLTGDLGRLDGVLEDGAFVVQFAAHDREPYTWSAQGKDTGPHMGGDVRTLHDFFDGCAGRSRPDIGTADQILAGLELAVAAETARKSGVVVRVDP